MSSPTKPSPDPGRSATEPQADRGFFGHPRLLAPLFSVELWERFSFYGMQGIVLLYMYWQVADGGLGIDSAVATGIVGAYGGTVYLCAILGGWVADHLTGSERAMFLSGILIMAGHISLALIPAVWGLGIGLGLIAIGSGGLKANITNLVGSLYRREDTRRDGGFSIFYMSVNIGGLLGPLLTGWAQREWGFHLAFGLAAAGMALGLGIYAWNRRSMPSSVHVVPDPLPRSAYPKWIAIAIAAVAVVVIAVASGLLTAANLAGTIVAVCVVAAVALFAIMLTSSKLTADEHSRVIAFIPLFIGTAAFFALFQQQFTVITVYADTRLDLDVFGWQVPIPWVQSFNPAFIILLAPVFAYLWTTLGKRQPVTATKFGVGLILMGSAFLIFLTQVSVAAVSVWWIALIMLVATMGELMVSPVGLSLSTKLSPEAMPVLMISLYYLAVALGTALSGSLAGFYSADSEAVYFGTLGAITIGIGVITLALSRTITRGMRGIR
ncbi:MULTISPECIES: peptide MFS transporter [Kocuria]|uniref:peptide MFS transporter n=1 Tax=Kocuria TaxID=57493 RepID=UPI0010F92C71|nr:MULTISPECIES: oligopeptide:H+ symporter [Kocuria]MCT1591515.1 oligopeptide:H+ symporter [Kocuria palustris]